MPTLSSNAQAAEEAPEASAAPQSPQPETLVLPIQGMTCSACQTHVERSLRETPGVLDAAVNLMTHSARVTYAPGATGPDRLVAAVEDAGYEATLPAEAAAEDQAARDEAAHIQAERRLRLHALLTVTGGVAAMLLSLPLMRPNGPVSSRIDALGHAILPALYRVPALGLQLILLALALAAILWTGRPIYLRAWRALLHRSTNMNTLVALGTGAAFLYSAIATFAPGLFTAHRLMPDVYYDSVLFILGFLLLGNWLDARAKRRTLDAVRAFAALQPATARILRDAPEGRPREQEIPASAVLPDDTVLVRPGERFPVDGIVLSGSSSADEALITGESVPVPKSPGDTVIGGALNYDGALEYRATSVGRESVLGQMLRLMEQAQSSKAPMQQLADRVSAIFVPAVLALALAVFLAWLAFDHANFTRAFAIAVTVLVIACPCAMGLAIPAALTVAVGRGAQLGILFKGGEAVERLAHVDTVVLDKTGTLTIGKPRVDHVFASDIPAVLRAAAALETRSEHPYAQAILEKAELSQIIPHKPSEFSVKPGKGVTGIVDGNRVTVGNFALLQDSGIPLPALPELDSEASAPGATLLYVAINGQYAGAIQCRDQLRPGAAEAVAALHKLGLRVAMLTGDHPAAARHIAAQAGIDEVHAGLLPAQKLSAISDLQQSGRKVLMGGDGINDAAALAQADAGLAMGTGADLAREAGDAILLRADLASITAAIRLARQARRIMRQNLGWALGYNLVGIPIAAGALWPAFGILLSPAVASAAMALSSVSVLTNSLRLKRYRPS